jgi:hypothetical protein
MVTSNCCVDVMCTGRNMRPSHEELQARVDAYIEQFDASVADEKDQRHQQKGQVCIHKCLCSLYATVFR